VAPDGKVKLKPVVIGRDFGTSVEILSGVSLTDQIVLSPIDSLEDGQQVQVTSGGGQQ
jgi:hypothetical protein